MNLNDHARTVELSLVNDVHGWGQEITYTYRRTNITVSPVKAFCQEGDLMQVNEKKDTVEDGMTFLSVELSSKPERGDKVLFNNVTWYVERLLGTNPYDIVCTSNMNHMSGRSGRKEI